MRSSRFPVKHAYKHYGFWQRGEKRFTPRWLRKIESILCSYLPWGFKCDLQALFLFCLSLFDTGTTLPRPLCPINILSTVICIFCFLFCKPLKNFLIETQNLNYETSYCKYFGVISIICKPLSRPGQVNLKAETQTSCGKSQTHEFMNIPLYPTEHAAWFLPSTAYVI